MLTGSHLPVRQGGLTQQCSTVNIGLSSTQAVLTSQ